MQTSPQDQFTSRWGIPIVVALLAIAARALLSTERTTLIGLARTIVVGLFVGAVTNLWLSDAGVLTDGARGAVVGVAAVVAEDVVLALLRLAQRLRNDPLLFVNWLLTTFTRAQPIPAAPAPAPVAADATPAAATTPPAPPAA
jgi:hypothetical protein